MKDTLVEDKRVESVAAPESNGSGHEKLSRKKFEELLQRAVKVNELCPDPPWELHERFADEFSVTRADELDFSFTDESGKKVHYNGVESLFRRSPNGSGWLGQMYFVEKDKETGKDIEQRRFVYRADGSINTLTTVRGDDNTIRWNQEERSLTPEQIKKLGGVLGGLEMALAESEEVLAEPQQTLPERRKRRAGRSVGRLALDEA